jgi:hypothetical protein
VHVRPLASEPNQEMNASDHSIVCAVFKCVAEILANGLEKLVDEREREKGTFTVDFVALWFMHSPAQFSPILVVCA